MDIEEYRNYCVTKTGVTEEFPFDSKTLVFKVMGKMFALCNVDDYRTINLKCDPEWAIELRTTNSLVQPGYHMNKKHWNTIDALNFPDGELLRKMIDHSYDLVVARLPKIQKEALKKGL